MKLWTEIVSEIHKEIENSEYEARTLAIHAQGQAWAWSATENATAESQSIAWKWHRDSRLRFDMWERADDRLRAMDAAKESHSEAMEERRKLNQFIRGIRDGVV